MTSYEKYLQANETLKNEPLPEIGVDWRVPGATKKIYLRVTSYDEDFADVLTVHSNWTQRKTIHWVRKMFWKSRQEFGEKK